MRAVQYRDNKGRLKLIAATPESYQAAENAKSGLIEGFKIRVLWDISDIEKMPTNVRRLPLVEMDKSKVISVPYMDTMKVVVIFNLLLFTTNRVQCFDGMKDVFFLCKIRNSVEEGMDRCQGPLRFFSLLE